MAKRAIQPAAYSLEDGSIAVVDPDVFYADDHPYVKAHPDWFVDLADEPLVQKPSRSRSVEQATAAPGEKRNR